MIIAAGTDYAIFAVGRYQEARGAGEDRETAYYSMFGGTAHVVLGSGLTIAGAMLCLSFTRLPYFQTMGVPCAIGTLVAVIAALTLGPAVITIGSRFGRLRTQTGHPVGGLAPHRSDRGAGPAPYWWPRLALAIIGLVTLPGYKTNYDARRYLPADLSANVGYDAAERHFSAARMNPELLMVESDHDLRNPAGLPGDQQDRQGDSRRSPVLRRCRPSPGPTASRLSTPRFRSCSASRARPRTMNEKYRQDQLRATCSSRPTICNANIETDGAAVLGHRADGRHHPPRWCRKPPT